MGGGRRRRGATGSAGGYAWRCGSSLKTGLGGGECGLLGYMGVEEPGLRDDGELRAQVWRVFHVGDGDRGTAEMPARVGRVLQVSEAGERGLAQVAGRNARWSTCRSCARWGSPGAPLSIGCRTGVEALRALLKAEDDTGLRRSEAERILRSHRSGQARRRPSTRTSWVSRPTPWAGPQGGDRGRRLRRARPPGRVGARPRA